MKEPYLQSPSGELVPYSRVPSEVLARVGRLPRALADPDQQDEDFKMRYAAILLQERST
jgi:hypothetical protein